MGALQFRSQHRQCEVRNSHALPPVRFANHLHSLCYKILVKLKLYVSVKKEVY